MPILSQKYRLVSTLAELRKVIHACKDAGTTALDFETTSLRPAEGEVRLVSLCNDKVHALVDFYAIGKSSFRKNAKLFEGGKWVVFNVGFEARWFFDANSKPTLWDLGNMRRAVLGGGAFSLARICQWDLGEEMSKEEQRSDWSQKDLTQSQLDYAYKDADITWRLWRYWSEQAGQERWGGFHTLNDMYPAVIEMEEAGMLLDHNAHRKLMDSWSKIKFSKSTAIRAMVGEDQVRNINSDAQWSDYFSKHCPVSFIKAWPKTEKTGQLSMTTATLKVLSVGVAGTPLAEFFNTLADYKTITKYLNSFGESLISASSVNRDKRIRARFNIGYAKTGRFSSSAPNLQQVPRDKDLLGTATSVRRSFVAGMGRRLVSLDYSGIELRVLALLSNDAQLLEDVVFGDVHSEVASKMAGRKIDKSKPQDKALRSKAKGVSFGIIYGSGAAGLAGTMRTTPDNAQDYIEFWATRYKNAFNYRYKMLDEALQTRFIKTIDGGTIYMGKNPELPRCANYPVQRAALSVMARAIVRHKESLDFLRADGSHKMTKMLATIHDALITETASKDAQEVLQIMSKDMILAYQDLFPDAPVDALVEGGIGTDWSALG
jgi:DNA polymerase-1